VSIVDPATNYFDGYKEVYWETFSEPYPCHTVLGPHQLAHDHAQVVLACLAGQRLQLLQAPAQRPQPPALRQGHGADLGWGARGGVDEQDRLVVLGLAEVELQR
jgi:hypothetical protein